MDIRDHKKPKKVKTGDQVEPEIGVTPSSALPYVGCERCLGCWHLRNWHTGQAPGYLACHYILDEGHSRGCPPEECDKYSTLKIPSVVHPWISPL